MGYLLLYAVMGVVWVVGVAVNIALYALPVYALYRGFTAFPRRLCWLIVPVAFVGGYVYLEQTQRAPVAERIARYDRGWVGESGTLPTSLMLVYDRALSVRCVSAVCAHPLLSGQLQRVVIQWPGRDGQPQYAAFVAAQGAECEVGEIHTDGWLQYRREGRHVSLSLAALRLLGPCLKGVDPHPLPEVVMYRNRAYADYPPQTWPSSGDGGLWHVARREADGSERPLAHFERMYTDVLKVPFHVEWFRPGMEGTFRVAPHLARDRVSYGRTIDPLQASFGYRPTAVVPLPSPEDACSALRAAVDAASVDTRKAAVEAMTYYLPQARFLPLAQRMDTTDDAQLAGAVARYLQSAVPRQPSADCPAGQRPSPRDVDCDLLPWRPASPTCGPD